MATHKIVAKGSLGGPDFVESPPGSGNYLVEAGFTIDLDTAPFNSGDTFIIGASTDDNVQFEDSSGSATVNIEVQTSNSNGFNIVVKDDIEANITVASGVSLASVYIDARSAGDVDLTIGDNVTLEEYQGSSGVDSVVIGDDFTTTKDFKTNNGDDTITIGQNATAPKFDAGNDNDTVITQTPGAVIDNAETILTPDGIVQGTSGNDTMGLGYSDVESDQITTGDNVIEAGGGNDTVTGFIGDDTIDGGDGIDTIDGGGGNDSLKGGEGADVISGNTGNDKIHGNAGADDLSGGAGTDTIYGGGDNDTISGGDNDDTLSGGDPSAGSDRLGFKWSDEPDPDDGGQIDTGDGLTGGTQTVGGVGVTYAISQNVTYMPGGEDASGETYTAGIDGGDETVDVNSAASIDDDSTISFTFSEAVENVQFRVNDLEINLGVLKVTAYDALGNAIAYTATEGSTVYGSNTDSVAGNDTFSASGSQNGDDTEGGSVLITIAGPVKSFQIDYTANNDSLTMTDVWFDDPAATPDDDGDDTIDGDAGDDTILAGTGNDTIDGGTGSDTYDAQNTGSLTDETITVTIDDTGAGTVQKTNDGTTDTLTSVETIVADEGAGLVDEITLSDVTNPNNVSGLDDSAVGTFTSHTGTVINFGPAETYKFSDVLNGSVPGGSGGSYRITGGDESGTIGNVSFSNFETINFDAICFARGSLIQTDQGEVPIEDLQVGDLVMTMDHGLQPIRWIDFSRVPARGRLAPIRIKAGALGNRRDLWVSPQHRMLIEGWQSELLFGEPQILASAKSLQNDGTIRRIEGGLVDYFHMLFDDHEIVFAEGAPSESFHPHKVGMDALSEPARAEIYELFPELQSDLDAYGAAARPSLKTYEGRVLSAMLLAA